VFNVVSFNCLVQDLFTSLTTSLGINPPQRHIPYSLAYTAALLSEAFAYLMGREPQLTRYRVKCFGTDRQIDAHKAEEILEFSPTYDLASTVADVVSWYSSIDKTEEH
jgi:nucleoside-diphosphate-sugar epimerase